MRLSIDQVYIVGIVKVSVPYANFRTNQKIARTQGQIA